MGTAEVQRRLCPFSVPIWPLGGTKDMILSQEQKGANSTYTPAPSVRALACPAGGACTIQHVCPFILIRYCIFFPILCAFQVEVRPSLPNRLVFAFFVAVVSSSSWQFKKQLTHIPRQFFTSVFLAWRCSCHYAGKATARGAGRGGGRCASEREDESLAAVFRKMKNSLVCFPTLAKRKRISRVCFPGQKDDVALNLAAISSVGILGQGREEGGGGVAFSGESVSCQHFDKFMRL